MEQSKEVRVSSAQTVQDCRLSREIQHAKIGDAMNTKLLSDRARRLFHLSGDGVKTELSHILDIAAARSEMSREELAALQLRKQICQEASRIIALENEQVNHAELIMELQKTREAVSAKGRIGSTAFKDVLSLPVKK